jgi:hypothetical protein
MNTTQGGDPCNLLFDAIKSIMQDAFLETDPVQQILRIMDHLRKQKIKLRNQLTHCLMNYQKLTALLR